LMVQTSGSNFEIVHILTIQENYYYLDLIFYFRGLMGKLIPLPTNQSNLNQIIINFKILKILNQSLIKFLSS
jgi:hypothetical protein